MLVLEEKDKKGVIASIIILVVIIFSVIGLLIFWSMSVGGFSINRQGVLSLVGVSSKGEEIKITDTSLEIKVFQDTKFKNLTAHAILPVEIGNIGREDPFASPYFSQSAENFSQGTNVQPKEIFKPE